MIADLDAARLLSVGNWPGPAEADPEALALVMLSDEGNARASPGGRLTLPGVCAPAMGVTAPEPKGWCLSLSAVVVGGGRGPPRLAARSEMMLRDVVMPSLPPALAPGVRVPVPSGTVDGGARAVPLLVLVLKLVRRLFGAATAEATKGAVCPGSGDVPKGLELAGSGVSAARPWSEAGATGISEASAPVPTLVACSDMDPLRDCTCGLDAPETGPSRTSSLGTAASYMSSLMLILVSANEGWRFLGVLAGMGMERAWRSCDDALDMDAASLEESSCSGSGASAD